VDTDEAALIERCRAGDLAAFEPLVEKYRQRAYRLAYNVLRDPDEAWDVAQDAFIRAFQALPSFRGDAAFYTWLFRIVMNVARGRGRRAAARSAPSASTKRNGIGSWSIRGPRPTPARRKSRSVSGSAARWPLCRSRTAPLSY